jgi:hypothetical protein
MNQAAFISVGDDIRVIERASPRCAAQKEVQKNSKKSLSDRYAFR